MKRTFSGPTGSSTSSYNWSELQQQSLASSSNVDRAESIISNGTLVDGTYLTPQQFGALRITMKW
jgi:hypothetical protein